jgi:hypothetical protein
MPEYSSKGVAKIAILIARILAAPDARFKRFKPINRYAPFKPPPLSFPASHASRGRI